MNLYKKKKFIINFVYCAVWIAIVILLLRVATIYLLPFLIGVVIAYSVQKPSRYLSEKTKISQQLCSSILSVVIFIIIVVLLFFLCSTLFSKFKELMEYLSQYSGNIRVYIKKFYLLINIFLKNTSIEFQDTVRNFFENILDGVLSKAGVFLSNIVTGFIKKLPGLLIGSVVTVVATCYISKDYNRLSRFINGFIDNNVYDKVIEFKDIFIECILKFFIGYFKIFLITFFELIIGFFFMRVKHFIILAFLIALLDMLPVIGTGTILLPWAIFSFLQNNYKIGFGLVILYFVICIVRNFIEPKIIGKQIGINPLFTLVFIFIGFRLGGIVGMMVLPITITVIFTYYRRKLLKLD